MTFQDNALLVLSLKQTIEWLLSSRTWFLPPAWFLHGNSYALLAISLVDIGLWIIGWRDGGFDRR